jgi:hypothetical protein
MERLVPCLALDCVWSPGFFSFCELNAVVLISRYKILKELGDGTCGCVYKAWDKLTGEIVSFSLQSNLMSLVYLLTICV